MQTQQQRPELPTVTLTWHACKYEVRKLHQRYILKSLLFLLLLLHSKAFLNNLEHIYKLDKHVHLMEMTSNDKFIKKWTPYDLSVASVWRDILLCKRNMFILCFAPNYLYENTYMFYLQCLQATMTEYEL